MNGSSHEFFSCAMLPTDEHSAVCWSDALDMLEDFKNFWILSDDVGKGISVDQFSFEPRIFLHEPLFFDGTPHAQNQLIIGKGFGEVIKGAQFHSCKSVGHCGVGGHNDYVGAVIHAASFLEDLHTVHIPETEVQQQHVKIILLQKTQPLTALQAVLHVVALLFQNGSAGKRQAFFVFNNLDPSLKRHLGVRTHLTTPYETIARAR